MDRKQTTIAILAGLIIAIIVGLANKLGGPALDPTLTSQEQISTPSGELGADARVTDETTQNKQMLKQYQQFPGELTPSKLKDKKVQITTNKGVIEMMIYPEATKAASNFLFLTRDKFYDGLTFHRVVPKFVIQGGDPLGDGSGGPGYQFEDEPVTRKYDKGIVAMANAGPNTNGSQFFIMLENNESLPPQYTIFGKVTKGMDVVAKIAVGDVMTSVSEIESKK
jgi:cyclophilin family peptidyl-prolyl cis-trans isomerase